jgi:hypothetical protein
MKNLLNNLEIELEKVQAPVLPLLNPGIEESEITKKLKSVGIALPPEALDFYKWHDGTHFLENKLVNGQSLFFGAMFPTLKTAIETYVFYTKSDRDFKKHFFSLFETQQGIMYLIDWDPKSDNYGMILKHDISRAIAPKVVTSVYDSVSCFIETITQCYRTGIYRIETQGAENILMSDYPAEIKISKDLNPKSAYWKLFDK